MDLFENDLIADSSTKTSQQVSTIADGAVLLHGFALPNEAQILADLHAILTVSKLHKMITPGGYTMSVAMTNCGSLGWVSDKKGYRYDALDPSIGAPWQPMPQSFLALAKQAALAANYASFVPDACLINQYLVGTKMGLHQDKDEQDFSQPIVSVSLGVSATFLFGGLKRGDKPAKIVLQHGDVIVWGGQTRLHYHGVMPLKASVHKAFGAYRYNLTFRKAA